MKKRDYKVIGIYYIVFIGIVAGIFYFKNRPTEIDYTEFTQEQDTVDSQSQSEEEDSTGKLSVGIGNDGIYETDDYTASIADVTDTDTWIYVDLKKNMDFNQQILDFSFLPNADEFPNMRTQPQFVATDNVPIIIENYVWGYGWHENYLRNYVLWNYTVDIDSELKLCLIGWANEDEVNHYDLYILVNPHGTGEYNVDSGKGNYEFDNYEYSDILLTEEDAQNITYFIDKYDRYPNKGEIELKGVVPYEKYKELFDLRPLEGRDAKWTVGKPLEYYPSFDE